MAAPRLLHIFSTFDAGGPQVRICRMIAHWGDGVVHEIAAHDGRYGAMALLPPDAPVTIARDVPFRNPWTLSRYLRRSTVDLVCTYNWGAMDVLMANRLNGQRPLVHHDEGFGMEEAVRQIPKRVLYRRLAYPGADKIVVVSRNLERIAADIWKQPKHRLVYVPNGIDMAAFSLSPVPGGLPGFERRPGEIVVGTVARINEVKNLPLLVEAVAIVRRRLPMRLVIVGEGPHMEGLRAATQHFGMTDSLVLPGFLPRPQDFIGQFDIFALSSDSEQFPISLVEAMAAGLPCATTDAGDCRDMLADANKPFVTPIRDAVALGNSLERLATDAALRRSLGDCNREAAGRRFAFPAMMTSYARLYSEVSGVAFPA